MGNTFPISVTGRLTDAPSLTYLDNGSARAEMRLAVEERELTADGSWKTRQTVFHQVVAWGLLAENAARTLDKGDAVIVAGDLRFRVWRDEATQRERTANEVRATHIGPDLRLASVTIDRRPRRTDTPTPVSLPPIRQTSAIDPVAAR